MDDRENVQADPRDQLFYPLYETLFHKFIVGALRQVFRLFMVMDVRGIENLPNNGGVILCSNHLNHFDVFPLQLGIHRMLFYMGKAELFKVGFVHYAFRNLGAFPVMRGAHDDWAIKHAFRVLDAGQVLAMFPEGTRSKGRGLKVGKTGAARLSIESGFPLVPVAIEGTQRFFERFPRRTCVTVKICEPIYPQPDDMPLEMTEKLMLTLAANLPPDLRGVYTEVPEAFKN